MDALHPTDAQIKAFLAHPASTGPVYMLNLLKFKERAEYEAGTPGADEDIPGSEAYRRYAAAFGEMLRELDVEGVETVFGGKANAVLIGDIDTSPWDAVALVRYPDAQTMFTTVSSDAYRSIHFHRKAGLDGQLLISCDDTGVF